jgi:hypothetical protein
MTLLLAANAARAFLYAGSELPAREHEPGEAAL